MLAKKQTLPMTVNAQALLKPIGLLKFSCSTEFPRLASFASGITDHVGLCVHLFLLLKMSNILLVYMQHRTKLNLRYTPTGFPYEVCFFLALSLRHRAKKTNKCIHSSGNVIWGVAARSPPRRFTGIRFCNTNNVYSLVKCDE